MEAGHEVIDIPAFAYSTSSGLWQDRPTMAPVSRMRFKRQTQFRLEYLAFVWSGLSGRQIRRMVWLYHL